MAIEFTVEDGTGLSTATSYLSTADTDQYNENYINDSTWSGAAAGAKQLALNQATLYIDTLYYGRWKGERTNETQALAWPRVGVVDADGYDYDSDEMPQKLLDATAELAIAAATDGVLLTNLSSPGTIKRKKVKADVVESEKEYVGGLSPQKLYSMALEQLRGLFIPSNRIFRA